MTTCTDCGTAPRYRNCKNGYCERCCDKAGHGWEQMDRLAELAAPQMVRALLLSEWSGTPHTMCPCCHRWFSAPGELRHNDGCSFDAALTAAGFSDQASRDEARRVMGEGET